MLKEVGIKFEQSVIFCDNQGAIKVAQKSSSQGRTKHIDIKLQSIKIYIEQKRFYLSYIPTELNVADIFTKPLGATRFQTLRKYLVADSLINKEECYSKEVLIKSNNRYSEDTEKGN